MPLNIISSQREGAVNVNVLKQHLRLVVSSPDEYTDEDNILQMYIRAATEEYEDHFKVALLTKTLSYEYTKFKEMMEIPRPPLQYVDSITYIDADGNEQTVAADNYDVTTNITPGRVTFKNSYTLPVTSSDVRYPVTITYKAGYGDDSSKVPQGIKLYLMNVIGTYYKSRESMLIGYGVTISVEDLRKNLAGLISGKPKAMRFG